MSHPSWLAHSRHAALLAGLKSIAWADGQLAVIEQNLIEQLVYRLGLSPSFSELRDWLLATPKTEGFAPLETDPFERRFLLWKAIELAMADGSYTEPERQCIIRWARAWSISIDEVEEMEQEVYAG